MCCVRIYRQPHTLVLLHNLGSFFSIASNVDFLLCNVKCINNCKNYNLILFYVFICQRQKIFFHRFVVPIAASPCIEFDVKLLNVKTNILVVFMVEWNWFTFILNLVCILLHPRLRPLDICANPLSCLLVVDNYNVFILEKGHSRKYL